METLASSLERLSTFLREIGCPPWKDMRVVFLEPRETLDEELRMTLARDRLLTVDEAREPFAALLARGGAWVNLSGVGLDGETLLVTVEASRGLGPAEVGTSVNLSGPERRTSDNGWAASRAVLLVER